MIAAIAACGLACAASGPTVAAAARDGASGPRVTIAFLPADPAPDIPLLDDLAERDALAVGLTSPSVGGYSRRQALLDIGQGARLGIRAYPDSLGRLDLRPDGRSARIVGWGAATRRASGAAGDVSPGLLGESIESGGGEVAYAGVRGLEQLEAIVAADATGGIDRVSLGTAGTLADRAADLGDESRLLVAALPEGEAGLAAVDRLLAERGEEDLVIVVRAPPAAPRLLPTGVAAPGFEGTLRSDTTRRTGLIAATDLAPTVLEHLGLAVPAEVEGEPIASVPGEASDARDLADRLGVVIPRRESALRWTFAGWLVLLAALAAVWRRAGVAAALRVGFLGALWLPGIALLTAALAPTQMLELAILTIGGLALGAATDRLVPWPGAPALPIAAVVVTHAADLAAGSGLIARSLAGPNPIGGARFYGLGNELETILALSVLIGIGAGLTLVPRPAARWAPIAFAAGSIVAGAIIGAGLLGAAVGGVITLGAGAAAAVLASLPGRLSGRRMAIAIVAPLAALAALVAIDLATGGGAHLSRSVLGADGPGDLIDIARRRLELSFAGLGRGGTPVSVGVAAGLLVVGVARRRTLLAPLDALEPAAAGAFRAGLTGALVAMLVGTVANDSGPVIFLIGTAGLLLAVAYVMAPPEPVEARAGPGPEGTVAPARSSTIPRCA